MGEEQRHDGPAEGFTGLTAVGSAAEAAILMGDLQAAGISSMQSPGARSLGLFAREIYVQEQDLERAREILNAAPISEQDLIRAEEDAAGPPALD